MNLKSDTESTEHLYNFLQCVFLCDRFRRTFLGCVFWRIPEDISCCSSQTDLWGCFRWGAWGSGCYDEPSAALWCHALMLLNLVPKWFIYLSHFMTSVCVCVCVCVCAVAWEREGLRKRSLLASEQNPTPVSKCVCIVTRIIPSLFGATVQIKVVALPKRRRVEWGI